MSTFFLGGLLSLSVLWPLLMACLLGFKPARSFALQVAPLAGLPALAASLLVIPNGESLHLPAMLLGSKIGLNMTGQVFLLLAALLWTVSGMYARANLSQSTRRVEFFIFFMLSMAGNFALIVAQDIFSFYLGFALMSFAAYGLVVFDRGSRAMQAGRVYIILVVASELILFVALLMAAGFTGATTFDAIRPGLALVDPSSRDLVILLSLIGFGIKAGMLGLHMWLPLAHPVAPASASAVLSGTMIKAGLLGWLQLLPLGEIMLPGWGKIIILFGMAAAYYGVAVGLTQRDPKVLLAYSSISQMGVMTMALGLGMLIPHAWPLILPAIAFYALHHGLSKGALFLGVVLAGNRDSMQRRWVWFGLWLPALALAGAPWTSGMIAKQLIKTNTLYAPLPWDSLLPLLLTLSALTTALLMARLLYLVRPAASPKGESPVAGLLFPWFILLLIVLLVPWWQVPVIQDLQMDAKSVIESLWPIVMTLITAWAVLRLNVFRTIQPLPAGDVLVLMVRGLRLFALLNANLVNLISRCEQWCQNFRPRLNTLIIITKKRLLNMEDYLARWEIAMFFAVILMLSIGLVSVI